jgi:N-methylhydantoinase A
MHANAVARLVGSFPIVIPPAPGLLCATGDLVADFRDEFTRTFIRTVDSTSGAEILKILEELGAEAKDWMRREGIPEERRIYSFNVDMRYYRQGYEIPIEITLEQLAESGITFLVQRFNQIHEQFYGFQMEGTPCEIVNLRAVGLGKVSQLHFPQGTAGKSSDSSHAVVDQHEVFFEGKRVQTNIYDRDQLKVSNELTGPAIITEFDSTTVVLSGYQAQVDAQLNILITPRSSS